MRWITCGLTETNRKRITNIWFMLEITRICRFIYLFFVFLFFIDLFVEFQYLVRSIVCDSSIPFRFFFCFSFSYYLSHYAHLAVHLNKLSFILKCLNKICILYFVLFFTVRPFRPPPFFFAMGLCSVFQLISDLCYVILVVAVHLPSVYLCVCVAFSFIFTSLGIEQNHLRKQIFSFHVNKTLMISSSSCCWSIE